RQASTGNVDWAWIDRTLRELEVSGPDAESGLLRARFEELTQKKSPQEAIAAYGDLASGAQGTRFTWTGVKDEARVDSFFDPFGNLLIRQRAAVELARVLFKTGAADEGARVIAQLDAELGVRKARQIDAYAIDYLRPETRGR